MRCFSLSLFLLLLGFRFLFFCLFWVCGLVCWRELVACWVGFRAGFTGWDLGIQGVLFVLSCLVVAVEFLCYRGYCTFLFCFAC